MAAITVTEAKVAPIFADSCMIRPYKVGTGGVVAGNVVYLDTTAGTVRKGSAGASGTKQAQGVALATKAEGEAVDVLEDGWLEGPDVSGLAYGALVYLSDTAGGLATTAGTATVVLGKVDPLSDRDPVTAKPSKVLRIARNVVANW